MSIKAADVKKLRDATGAGMMDCKKALIETDGDMDKATEFLRKKGIAKAGKRTGRATAEGLVHSYIHGNGKIGVLMEVNCETDFVARTDDFQALVKDLCMQVAAVSPQWVSRESIPQDKIDKELEIYKEQARASGKPEKIIDKIATGKLEKYFSEVCLLDQPFIKDDKTKVKDRITEAIAKVGENITVRRFIRYQVGEA